MRNIIQKCIIYNPKMRRSMIDSTRVYLTVSITPTGKIPPRKCASRSSRLKPITANILDMIQKSDPTTQKCICSQDVSFYIKLLVFLIFTPLFFRGVSDEPSTPALTLPLPLARNQNQCNNQNLSR